METKPPIEAFWPDLQPLLDRSTIVAAKRREQRDQAIAATARRLNEQLRDLLQKLNPQALASRCLQNDPPLPTGHVTDLHDPGRWQRHGEVHLRAFFVLSRVRDGKRILALSSTDHWSPGCVGWQYDDANFRGYIPTALLELVYPRNGTHQSSDGQRYTLFLHADRIRFSGCDEVWNDTPLQAALQGLTHSYGDLDRLNRQTRPLLPTRPLPTAASLETHWSRVVLPTVQKEALARLQCRWLVNEPGSPRSVLISGPTGVGKSCIARALADKSLARCIHLDDLLTEHDTNKAAIEQIEQLWTGPESLDDGEVDTRPLVLLLEDCEQWFGVQGEGRHDLLPSAILLRSLLRCWDQALRERDVPIGESDGSSDGMQPPRVLLVAITRHPERLDPAIRSRFDQHLAIEVPDAVGREALLRQALADTFGVGGAVGALEETSGQPIDALINASRGMSGRNLIALVKSGTDEPGDCASEAVSRALTTLKAQRQRDNPTVDVSARWDRLVLPTATREALEDLVFQLQEAQALRKAGFKPATAVLLHGPPGTGKTQSARTLANEAGMAFIAASTAELKAGYIGQSGERVRQLFASARERAPAILFLDELDAVATHRESASTDSFNREVVTQLLQEIDGVRDHSAAPVLVIAATNRMEVLDPAILSRFRETLLIDLPTAGERVRLLDLLLTSVTVDVDAAAWMRRYVQAGHEGTPPPASHRDVEQWFHRVLAMSLRRIRRERLQGRSLAVDANTDAAPEPMNELTSKTATDMEKQASIAACLRVTLHDVVASLGVATDNDSATVPPGQSIEPLREAA